MAKECSNTSCDKSSCEGCSSKKPQSLLAEMNAHSNVKHVIGVVSGKGGMNMPGKNIIHFPFIQAFIDHPAYRHMTHKDLKPARILKPGQKLRFIRPGLTLILRRQAVPVNTADPKLLLRNLHILILTIQNLRAGLTIKLMKISPIILQIGRASCRERV